MVMHGKTPTQLHLIVPGLVPFGPLADAFHLFDAWDGLAT